MVNPLSIGEHLAEVETTLARLESGNIIKRLWQKDHTVWKQDSTEITNRLGWLTVTDSMSERVPAIKAFAREVKEAGFSNIVLLGMGGSSLGAEVLRVTFGSTPGYPELVVLDTTVPAWIQAVSRAIDPPHTLFIISSKSGTTMEPLFLYEHFKSMVSSAVGEENAGSHFTAITDSGTPLATLAEANHFRGVFLNPPDIGGRYSVLSYFGLVPAALIGADISALLDRANNMRAECASSISAGDNPGAWLGAYIATLTQLGRDKLTLLTSPALVSFGLWVEQLIAESTGKEGKGAIPVVGEPLLEPADYGNDRSFIYLRLNSDNNANLDSAVQRLIDSGQPVLTLKLQDKYDLGAEFFRWEFATALAGAILDIHPFNQPNVQQAKDMAARMLQEYRNTAHFPPVGTADSIDELLLDAGKGKYLAIMAYLRQTPRLDQALASLRRRIGKGHKMATTLGYGPRFLHSTGQLHKGGPDKGLFLQLTAETDTDLPVPGKDCTFGVVAQAQATGDLLALKSLGRRIVRINFAKEDDGTITSLIDQLA